ncbi:MAG: hypothetical protein WC376_04750 [Candidatus Nanoarchaeia archaeon]|jgi:hypothetical protein
MNKAQSFGFDLLMIILGLTFFSELIYTSFFDFPKDYFFQRNIENNELLRAVFMQNNSLAYFDCFLAFSSNDCLKSFNESIKASLSSYLGNRKYLLSFCGLKYSNADSENFCFTKAIPYYLNISLPNGDCEVYFSIYNEGEVIDCA